MTTVYDVPANQLISRVAEKLKEEGRVKPPEWSEFVKTGVNREMPPINSDWWYVRSAALLRRIYIDGPVGVSRLRTAYGGKRSRRVASERFVKGSGSVIRVSLQQLEKAGLVRSVKEGREITPQGRSMLDNIAYEVEKQLKEE